MRLPGADACVGPVELADRVERRLGRTVFVRANDAIVVIEGRIGVAKGGFSVTETLRRVVAIANATT